MRRPLVILLATLAAGDAWAGGLGIVGTGDFRTQTTYYYDVNDTLAQYQLTQMILAGGVGFEVILGDKDDRLIGLFRGFWIRETAEKNPADLNPEIDPGDVVATVREVPRDIGVAMAGIEWGFWGDPEGFMLTAAGLLGSGFLTKDHTEYFQLEIGPGISWEFAKDFRLVAAPMFQLRYRKGFEYGMSAYVGFRYFFD